MLCRQPFRGSDLILLSSTLKGVDRHDEVQILVLVESVDRDPTNRDQQVIHGLVYINPKDSSMSHNHTLHIYMAGNVARDVFPSGNKCSVLSTGATGHFLQTIFLPRTEWEAKHLLSCVPHLRQLKVCRTCFVEMSHLA